MIQVSLTHRRQKFVEAFVETGLDREREASWLLGTVGTYDRMAIVERR